MRLSLELVAHGGNTAGFEIPDEVVAELGGGNRPKVVLRIGEHEFRASIARMGGQFLLGLSQERRAEAGVAAGQVLDIEITLDEAPRTVDVPDDLQAVLDADPAASTAWQAWSFTKQKEAARQLTEAKRPETRATRLEKIRAQLAG